MFWRNLLLRDRVDQEWREEMESHLQMLTESLLEQGLTPDEARDAALRQVGNLTARREEIYHMNGIQWLDSIAGDVRYAVRGLRKHPSFTAIAVLTLALGIGANTAIFSVVNSVLLKPLAFPHAEELVDLALAAPGAGGIVSSRGSLGLSASMYFTYAEQNRSFQSMGVWIPRHVTVTGMAEPEQVSASLVSDGLLQALSVQPVIGRPLVASDQVPGSNEVALLTYGYWQRRFGGDRSVIGRKIIVDARPREIVGILPAGFRIADTPADLVLPLRLDRSHATLAGFGLLSIARLKPGVTIEQANADIARLIPVWMRSWPSIQDGKLGDALAEKVYRSWRIGPNLRPLRESVVGNVRGVLWVVMGTLGMVMLIACANVANLLLVRVDARQQELAVRAALGAGWGRIVRQLLIESLVLCGAGGALGLVIASAALHLLVENGPSNLPRLSEIGLDARALAFTSVVAVLSGLFFGLVPALRYAGPRASFGLRDGGRTMSHSRSRHRARNTLVVVQVSLALVLLISSGLMIRTFQAMRRVDVGFARPDALQTFRIFVPRELAPKEEEATRMEQTIAEKVAAIPGVTSVGFASALPMDGAPPNWDGILMEGQSYAQGSRPPMRLYLNVSPGLFRSLGTNLKAGRDFTWTDIYGDRKFVLVSEGLARELWDSPEGAIGKRVRSNDNGPWREVIGVVADVRHRGAQEPAPAVVYWPIFGQIPYAPITGGTRAVTFSVRTDRAGTGALLNEIRRVVWSVNAALAVANPETMRETLDLSMARTSFTLVMLAIAGAMALLLGLIGIYGVIAYAVSQRTREIGIRLALGARPGDVRQMFVRYGLNLCAIGITIGLAAAAVLTRVMKSLLFGVAPVDPVTFAAVPVALLLAVLAACYLPARRASAVNPVECIRAE
ncbi:ABC transporter permease [uncultured Paludibaculum sp.]|uniref:ABC transporter permease n=1 Tax=uncultured Paludibaculum sp. TaxID=1765020 RepID=UPI002AAB607A|nr:ABC transporter permease [uncultured Paludibaculum sp.]